MLTGGVLCWDDPNPPGVVESFNVYWRSGAPLGKWTRVANVTNTSCPVQFFGDQGFFTVTASNAVDEVPQVPVGGSLVVPSAATKLLPPKLK